MPAIPIFISSSSLIDPCPAGTGIGYATFNDTSTIYVVCDAAFYRDQTARNLGLGLGLGIPAFLVLIYLFQKWLKRKCRQRSYPALLQLSPEEEVTKRLTGQSLLDFKAGNLTDTLKEELMVLRVREGRNLTEFGTYANELNHDAIADFIEHMNITTFPSEIHRKAYRAAAAAGEP
jgi:hypothetical protein